MSFPSQSRLALRYVNLPAADSPSGFRAHSFRSTRYDSNEAVEVVQRLDESGVYARVLGNVAYIMVSPTTPVEACRDLMSTVAGVLAGIDTGRTSSEPNVAAYSI